MLVAAKTYALISEYALICDMRLITREYGMPGKGGSPRSSLAPAIFRGPFHTGLYQLVILSVLLLIV